MFAERVLNAEYTIDSAGTGGWYAGLALDPRSIAAETEHGIDITAQKTRKMVAGDFERFDLILGMDHSNVDDFGSLTLSGSVERFELFIDHTTGRPRDMPILITAGKMGSRRSTV